MLCSNVGCSSSSSTCVSFEGGDQTTAVQLQLEDGHLTRVVAHKGVPRLHVEPGRGRVKDANDRLTELFASEQLHGFAHTVFILFNQCFLVETYSYVVHSIQ